MFISIGQGTDTETTLRTLAIEPEFVRCLVIESKAQYCQKFWTAAASVICHIMMGAVNMIVLQYAIITKDCHAILFTFAFHLLSPEGILAWHFESGWTIFLHLKHRKLIHILLQICSFIFIMIGAIVVFGTMDHIKPTSLHNAFGFAAFILALLSAMLGFLTLQCEDQYKKINKGHSIVGLMAFTLSSICLCLGIFSASFEKQVGRTLQVVTVFFVIFYTIFILYKVFERRIIMETSI